MLNTVNKGSIWTGEIVFVKKNGEAGICKTSVIPLERDGLIIGTVGVNHDITDYVRIQNELKEAHDQLEVRVKKKTESLIEEYAQRREVEKRFIHLADNVNAYIWVQDMITKEFQYVSPGYQKMTGYSQTELYKDATAWLNIIYPDDRGIIIQQMKKYAIGVPFSLKYRIVDKDKHVKWVWNRGFPHSGEENGETTMLGVVEDITELKEMVQMLLEQKFELEKKKLHLNDILSKMGLKSSIVQGKKC